MGLGNHKGNQTYCEKDGAAYNVEYKIVFEQFYDFLLKEPTLFPIIKSGVDKDEEHAKNESQIEISSEHTL